MAEPDDGKKKSGVWKYFDLSGDKTKCTLCSTTLSFKGGGTSSMRKHLSAKHPSFANTGSGIVPLKQNTLEGHFRRPISRGKYQSYTEKAALACVKDLRPMSLFEGEGIREFCVTLNASYIPPTHKTVKKFIMAMYENEKAILISKLRSQTVALTTDMWTSLNGVGYITVTGHYISEDWKLQNVMLATRDLHDRHTAVNIAEALNNITEEFQIPEVIAISTDNASNMDLACRTAGIQRVRCFAHTLQLAVHDGLSLQGIDNLIINARKLVEFFNKSIPATTALIDHQKKLGKKPKGVVSDVLTRWNSSYFMIERLHLIKADLYAVLNDPAFIKHKQLILKENHWILADQMLPVLKPLVSATEVLATEEYPSCCSVYPLVFGLIGNHLQLSDLDSTIVRDFKTRVVNGLQKRLLSDNEKFHLSPGIVASILDPQYKKLKFMLEDKRLESYNHIKELLSQSINKQQSLSQTNEFVTDENEEMLANVKMKPGEPSAKRVKEHSNVLHYLMGDIIEINDQEDECVTAETEFASYLTDPDKNIFSSPLDWWKANQQRYPNLGKLARKYMCIPATSVSSERAFSTAGLTITKERSSLEPDVADAIIFLHINLRKAKSMKSHISLDSLSNEDVVNVKVEGEMSVTSSQSADATEPALPDLPDLTE